MSRALRYPVSACAADLARAGAGLAAVSAPLLLSRPSPWIAVLLLGAGVAFAAFVGAALWRLRARLVVDGDGVRVSPGNREFAWSRLEGLALGAYSTRRDGRDAWLELRVRAAGRTLRIDSRLEGFERVLRRALDAAERRDVALTPTTLANLAELGLRPAAAGAPPPAERVR